MNRDNVVRWFMVAAILISIKAFFVDDYLKERALKEAQGEDKPHLIQEKEDAKEDTQYINSATGAEREEKMVQQMEGNGSKKMPLDELGDKMSKHIKL